jgi:hypothetical protein
MVVLYPHPTGCCDRGLASLSASRCQRFNPFVNDMPLNMPPLPPFKGTPAQIKWANTIRLNTLEYLMDQMPPGTADYLVKIVDATWWIANRDMTNPDRLRINYKEPSPHQMVGGPPPPGQTPDLPVQGAKKPLDAEMFASSVSHVPALAEITVLALMAHVYKGEIRERLKLAAMHKLTEVQSSIRAALDRDVDGIKRILDSLDKKP